MRLMLETEVVLSDKHGGPKLNAKYILILMGVLVKNYDTSFCKAASERCDLHSEHGGCHFEIGLYIKLG